MKNHAPCLVVRDLMELVARRVPAEGERGRVEEETLEGERVRQERRARVYLRRVDARTPVASEALHFDRAQVARLALAELVEARQVRLQVYAMPDARRRAPQLVVQRERRVRVGTHPLGNSARRVRAFVFVHRQCDARRRMWLCVFIITFDLNTVVMK